MSMIRRSTRERKKPKEIYEVHDPRIAIFEELPVRSDAESQEDDDMDEVDDNSDKENKDNPSDKDEDMDKNIVKSIPKKRSIKSKKGTTKKTTAKKTTDTNTDDDENNKNLFDIISRGKDNFTTVLQEWRDRFEENADDATQELLNCLFHACCGSSEVFLIPSTTPLENIDMGECIQTLVSNFNEQITDAYYPLAARHQQQRKKITKSYRKFWQCFVNECVESELLFTTDLFPKILDWFTTLTSAEIRPIRHTTTVTILAISDALVEALSAIDQQLTVITRQINASRKNASKAKSGTVSSQRLVHLLEDQSLYKNRVKNVSQILDMLFTGVIVHRYRDVMPEIRRTTMETLGNWILGHSSTYLQDQYLKYLGWALNDKASSVRQTATHLLKLIYEDEELETPKLELFSSRFLPRLVQLCMDVDENVVETAIRLLIAMDKRSLIHTEIDLHGVEILVFHESSQAIRQAAAEFVCLQYDAFGVVDTTGIEELTRQQMNTQIIAMVEFAEEYVVNYGIPASSMEYLIQAFWQLEDATVVQQWDLMMKTLLTDKAAPDLSSDQQTLLLYMLTACLRKHCVLKGGEQSEGMSVDERANITLQVCQGLPTLLRLYQNETDKLNLLVEILLALTFENQFVQQHVNQTVQVVEKLIHVFQTHSDVKLLVEVARSLAFLMQNEVLKRHTDVQIHEVVESVIDQLSQKLEEQKVVDAMTDDSAFALEMSLCRLKCLMQHINIQHYLPSETAIGDGNNGEQSKLELIMVALSELVDKQCKIIKGVQTKYKPSSALTLEYALGILHYHLMWQMTVIFHGIETKMNICRTSDDTKQISGDATATQNSFLPETQKQILFAISNTISARSMLESTLEGIFDMHILQDPEIDLFHDAEELRVLDLDDETLNDMKQYILHCQHTAFITFCDTRCLFPESFNTSVQPYSTLIWEVPRTLLQLSQQYFERRVNLDEENADIQTQLLLALAKVSLCHPSNKRQAAAVVQHLKDLKINETSETIVKAFIKQLKSSSPVRYLEIQMTILRQLFQSILITKDEHQESQGTNDTDNDSLSDKLLQQETQLKELAKKLSQSLGVGNIQASLRAPFFRFLCEGVRFSLEHSTHVSFLDSMKPYISHLDQSSKKQLQPYAEQLLEKLKSTEDLDESLENIATDFKMALMGKKGKSTTPKAPKNQPKKPKKSQKSKTTDSSDEESITMNNISTSKENGAAENNANTSNRRSRRIKRQPPSLAIHDTKDDNDTDADMEQSDTEDENESPKHTSQKRKPLNQQNLSQSPTNSSSTESPQKQSKTRKRGHEKVESSKDEALGEDEIDSRRISRRRRTQHL